MVRARWVAQFAQGLGFYLTDALTRDIKLLADFFKGVIRIHIDAKAHAQYFGFARCQPGENFSRRLH